MSNKERDRSACPGPRLRGGDGRKGRPRAERRAHHSRVDAAPRALALDPASVPADPIVAVPNRGARPSGQTAGAFH
jgi:hypothetical protein